VMSLYWKHDM